MIEVATGDYKIAHVPEIIKTSGIGSCIVIILYDPSAKFGALAHIMLPQKIESTLSLMLNELHTKSNLVAKIYGGANMFPDLWSGDNSIGSLNIKNAREILAKLELPIVQEDVGGEHGRSLEFDLENGNVEVLCQKY